LEQQRDSEWLAETATQFGDALIMGLLCLEQDGEDRLREFRSCAGTEQ